MKKLLKWIWEQITRPFLATYASLKRKRQKITYFLEVKNQVHTTYLLIIIILCTFFYSYISKNNFYHEYDKNTKIAQAKTISFTIKQKPKQKVILLEDDKSDEARLTSGEIKNRIIAIAKEKDFKWTDYLLRLSTCENPNHVLDLPANAGNVPADSIDRGLYGINSYHHKEVSDECAYDIKCATEWTMWRIESGWQKEWCCNDLVKENPSKYNWL